MLKPLPKTSHQLTICEGNFLRLERMSSRKNLKFNHA